MKHKKYLVYDIEAIAQSEAAYVWREDQEKRKAKGETVGPDEFAPIPAWGVISIGMLVLDGDFNVVDASMAGGGCVDGGPDPDEQEILKDFCATVVGDAPTPLSIVDWNGRGFDMPVIQARCFRYGIQIPWYFSRIPDNYGKISQWSKTYNDRYQGRHIDVCDRWSHFGASRRPHLAELSALMGMPGKSGMDGSKVEGAYKDRLYGAIDRYCLQDVFQTALVFLRYLHVRGTLPTRRLREASESILGSLRDVDPEFYGKFLLDRTLLNEGGSV